MSKEEREQHLRRLKDIFQSNFALGEANGTKKNKESAVSQWKYFMEVLLNWTAMIPRQHICRLTPSEKQERDMLLLMFAAALSEKGHIPGARGHETAKATLDVISAVDVWHIEREGLPLRSEDFKRKISRFVKGRDRLKPHTPRLREGYSHLHLVAMNRLCKSYPPDRRWFTGKKNFKGVNGRFDAAFVSTIVALRAAAFSNLMRLGELTGIDDTERQRFNPHDRPTVASIDIHRREDGSVTHLTMAPTLYKTRGSVFSDVPLSFVMTEHDNNACRLILDMMEKNPLKPGQDPKLTPLFRFPASAGKLVDKVIDPTLLIRIDREAIDAIDKEDPSIFQAYSPAAKFCGHSYKIGGAVALLLANAPRHILMSAGRWSSEAYLLYLRIGAKKNLSHWQAAMYNTMASDQIVCKRRAIAYTPSEEHDR